MAKKITSEVLESYFRCKFKSYLKLAGKQGTRCDFEAMLAELRAEVRRKAIEAIIARHPEHQIARNIALTPANLKRGPQYILDGAFEEDSVALHCDGLKRTEGASMLGDFHYMPVLFQEGQKVRKEQRLLLAVYGLLLSGVQGRAPQDGVIWHGRECKATRVHLNPHRRNAERVLQDLKEMAGADSPPRLFINAHCPVCEFRERCNKQAVEEDNLSLLLGMREKEVSAYNRKGFFTVTQISHTFRYRKPRKRAKVHEYPHYYSLQARSIRTGIVHIHGTPSLPKPATRVYLDIEGIPDRDFYYLIGALVETGHSSVYHSLWADHEGEQEAAFLRLGELVGSLSTDCLVFHYGTYEATALRKMIARIPPEKRGAVQAVVAKMVNVLSIIHRHVYFPTYSNTLKEVGRALGCQWTSPEASGVQSIVWREWWERTHDPAIKDKLLTYNREDCLALERVCGFVADAGMPMPKSGMEDGSGPKIVPTSDLPRPPSKWPAYGRPSFVLPDLERASECAYFDYQRERVYVRTNKRFKAINRRAKRDKLPLTVNKRVVTECGSCPACGGNKIKKTHRLRRKTIDIKFFKGGVKKWVVLHRSWAYRCDSCGARFLPADWPQDRSQHQAGLMCWCVYQNIECRQSMWQVEETLADLFGLRVDYHRLYRFKTWIAQRYEGLYEEIRRSILRGHLVHVDEATVDLRNNEKGYVWVLASLDKVYYFYRSSREGSFLKEMLEGFTGVLVSDFFSAYESVGCLQQKCLLHFLRDVNDDLQKNPFDEEFKSFAHEFASLLRRIVETIDKKGLSASCLSKHVPDARRFIEAVSGGLYSSDVMIHYQKRIKKSGGRMFTFLEHDGVPWNNNNAEHAIKYLARYKRVCEGMFSERSLKESLVLLSVFQTCHFNGVNVVGFLLSEKSDLGSILGT